MARAFLAQRRLSLIAAQLMSAVADGDTTAVGSEEAPGPSIDNSQAGDDKSDGEANNFPKSQRIAIGGVGALLTTVGSLGLGKWAWRHYPRLVTGGACGVATGGGAAMLAVAVQGGLPRPTAREPSPKRMVRLRLLNDEALLVSDIAALARLRGEKPWPIEVQKALAVADRAGRASQRASAAQRDREVLAEVRQGVADGASGVVMRRRLRPCIFVVDFPPVNRGPRPEAPGGASAVDALAASVNFVLAAAAERDEVLLRLTSPGGSVTSFGLAAAQLQRLRTAGLRLTACVDTVAASGGYMMACVADRIVAAPFAMVGSIGVIAGVPNVHRLLERNEVEFQQVTAGKYKRTVNVLTANTDEGLAKFREEIEEVHDAFKSHVQHWRPGLNVEEVATGEVWFGEGARKLGLIDDLGTSDEVIRCMVQEGFDAVEVGPALPRKTGLLRLLGGIGTLDTFSAALMHQGNTAAAAAERLVRAAAGTRGKPRVEVARPRVDARL